MKIHKQSTFLANYVNDLPHLLHPGIIKLGCWTVQMLLCEPYPRLFIDLKLSGGSALRKQWVTAELPTSSYLIEGRAQQDACLEPKVSKGWHCATRLAALGLSLWQMSRSAGCFIKGKKCNTFETPALFSIKPWPVWSQNPPRNPSSAAPGGRGGVCSISFQGSTQPVPFPPCLLDTQRGFQRPCWCHMFMPLKRFTAWAEALSTGGAHCFHSWLALNTSPGESGLKERVSGEFGKRPTRWRLVRTQCKFRMSIRQREGQNFGAKEKKIKEDIKEIIYAEFFFFSLMTN